ncbi:unnamed protein product [Rhizophagus irregularis]|uniref:Uncharacterized protein n=1 Tax=Rhizophagus irregularis TaxID=588596 RepID=A0A2N1N2V3_9GLOM|nr:hypothetical protein RhiirC2_782556 [Rhizophagus irregularis]CAB5322896.1 unnamed protein product [Rhizophagus irregularis]
MARDPSIYTSDLKFERAHTAVNDDTLGHTVRQSGNILHHIDTQPIGVGNRSGRITFTTPYNNHNIRINETAYIRWTSSNFLHAGDWIIYSDNFIFSLPSTIDYFYNNSFTCNLVN